LKTQQKTTPKYSVENLNSYKLLKPDWWNKACIRYKITTSRNNTKSNIKFQKTIQKRSVWHHTGLAVDWKTFKNTEKILKTLCKSRLYIIQCLFLVFVDLNFLDLLDMSPSSSDSSLISPFFLPRFFSALPHTTNFLSSFSSTSSDFSLGFQMNRDLKSYAR